MLAQRTALLRLGILEALSEEQTEALRERLTPARLSPGQKLFSRGEKCEHLHLVQDGLLELCLAGAGHEKPLTVGRGAALGEFAVITGGEYPFTAQALEPSTVASLHRDEFRRLVDTVPGFGWQVMRVLSRRLVTAQERLLALASPDVRVRIGAVVLHLVQEEPEAVVGGAATLHVRQSEVGEMAGVARETVSRVLAEWSRQGLVAVGRGRVIISEISRLRELVDAGLPASGSRTGS